MPKKVQQRVQGLLRLITYVLAHRPDEFGLVPDDQGFVTVKELLQALHEEPEWRYVRVSHIHEAFVHGGGDLFDLEDKRIRAKQRNWQHDHSPCGPPSQKILYTPIRKRAHHVVFENGVRASSLGWVILCSERDMALRIGKRKDPEPVILEVRAMAAFQAGHPLYRFGSLFLAKAIPAQYISGPLPPKQEVRRPTEPPRPKQKVGLDFSPGTFRLDLDRDPDLRRRQKGRKPKGWKEQARKMRKGKKR